MAFTNTATTVPFPRIELLVTKKRLMQYHPLYLVHLVTNHQPLGGVIELQKLVFCFFAPS